MENLVTYIVKQNKETYQGPNNMSCHLGPCELCDPPSELAVVHVVVDLGSQCVAALPFPVFTGNWSQ